MTDLESVLDAHLGRATSEDRGIAVLVAASFTNWVRQQTEELGGSHFIFNPTVEVHNAQGYRVASIRYDYDTAEAVVSFSGYGRPS